VIVLPLMAGSTYDLLKCNEYDNGLPLEVCKKILIQTLYGIRELEKHNMMHTDIKPENILVCGLNKEEEILFEMIQNINIKTVHQQRLNKIISDNPNISDTEKWLSSYKLFKEITKTIIQFMNTKMDEIRKQMKICKISSKYITDIRIKLCDFNLVIDVDENLGDNTIEIQTRYYRAPEIIMGCGLHKKTDYWSIGCVFFELLTGEILFDPEKDEDISRDIHHIYLIEELMGPIPKTMIANASKRVNIFDNKCHIKGVGKRIKRWNLQDVLKENHDNVGLSDDKINKIIRFINTTLNISPDNRPNIKTMIDSLKIIDHVSIMLRSDKRKIKNKK
jgi:serine/threonine-protein kinase SRPK3